MNNRIRTRTKIFRKLIADDIKNFSKHEKTVLEIVKSRVIYEDENGCVKVDKIDKDTIIN